MEQILKDIILLLSNRMWTLLNKMSTKNKKQSPVGKKIFFFLFEKNPNKILFEIVGAINYQFNF